MRSSIVIATGMAFLLSACGTTSTDRGLSGAGIGAGAGVVVGAVTGLTLLEGALLGAAAGGLTGVLTDREIIDLGDPFWAKNDQPANGAATARVQAGLRDLGYNPGPIDGVKGTQTTQAIRDYQRDNGLLVDGQASYELASHIDGKLGG
ncbi:MAG: peptidoglycan-binding protein [Rhodobacteraceae bacterium]|nr:peptidoglycan-binding protein [Paracoccaceae bacterium]